MRYRVERQFNDEFRLHIYTPKKGWSRTFLYGTIKSLSFVLNKCKRIRNIGNIVFHLYIKQK